MRVVMVVPAISLQVLVENEKRARGFHEPSASTGLRTLDERCRLAPGRGIEIAGDAQRFTVRLPARIS